MGEPTDTPKVLAKATAALKLLPKDVNNASYLSHGLRITKCVPSETIPGVSTCEIEILDTPEGRKALEDMKGKYPPGVSMSFAPEE